MSSPAYVAFLQELETILAKFLPKLEGWEDARRLNLIPGGHQKADEGIASRRQFVDSIRDAIRALDVLQGQGYPTPAPIKMEDELREDLRSNIETLIAAFEDSEPTAGQAVDGKITIFDLESQ